MESNTDWTIGAFQVQPQLNRLSAVDGSGAAPLEPRVMEVLVCLAKRPGEVVAKSELLDAVWPDVEVTEDVLKNAVWELRKAFGDDARAPRYIQTITKRGYRLIAPVSQEPSMPSPRRRRSPAIALSLTGIAVAAAMGAFYFAGGLESARSDNSGIRLAVLPFDSLNQSQDETALGDGLTIDLISRLGRLSPDRLGVVAPSSALIYDSGGKDAGQIGWDLQVDYVVRGSVRREGEHVRVTAHLLRVSDGLQIWSQSYAREATGVLELQDELATAIALSVEARLDPGPRPAPPSNREAYEAYLLGNHFQFRIGDWDKAIAAFERAVELDPHFALARAKLSYAYFWGSQLTPREAIAKARQAGRLALQSDDRLAEAHIADALIRLYGDFDYAGAEKAFQRALELEPSNSSAHMNYSKCLAASGRLREAIAQARTARELDPLSPMKSRQLAWTHYLAGDIGSAISEYLRALELNERSILSHLSLARCYADRGDFDRAFEHRERAMRLSAVGTQRISEASRLYREEGYNAVLAAELRALEEDFQKKGYLRSTAPAALAVQLEDRKTAWKWLRQAANDHVLGLIYLNVSPEFAPLRDDPSFAELTMGH